MVDVLEERQVCWLKLSWKYPVLTGELSPQGPVGEGRGGGRRGGRGRGSRGQIQYTYEKHEKHENILDQDSSNYIELKQHPADIGVLNYRTGELNLSSAFVWGIYAVRCWSKSLLTFDLSLVFWGLDKRHGKLYGDLKSSRCWVRNKILIKDIKYSYL